MAETLCYSSPPLTETEFGFGRHTVELGMHEKRTGMICYGNYASSGKRKSEDVSPQLAEDIRCLVEPESQADPQLRNTFAYTRVTAKSVRQKLIEEKNWDNHSLPQVRTVNNILNRLGYKLRKVEKTKPEKNPGNRGHLCQYPQNQGRCQPKKQRLATQHRLQGNRQSRGFFSGWKR